MSAFRQLDADIMVQEFIAEPCKSDIRHCCWRLCGCSHVEPQMKMNSDPIHGGGVIEPISITEEESAEWH